MGINWCKHYFYDEEEFEKIASFSYNRLGDIACKAIKICSKFEDEKVLRKALKISLVELIREECGLDIDYF